MGCFVLEGKEDFEFENLLLVVNKELLAFKHFFEGGDISVDYVVFQDWPEEVGQIKAYFIEEKICHRQVPHNPRSAFHKFCQEGFYDFALRLNEVLEKWHLDLKRIALVLPDEQGRIRNSFDHFLSSFGELEHKLINAGSGLGSQPQQVQSIGVSGDVPKNGGDFGEFKVSLD